VALAAAVLADVMRVGFVPHRQADAAIKSRVFLRVEGTFRRKGCGPLVIRLPAKGRFLTIHEKVNSASRHSVGSPPHGSSFGQSPDCIPRRTIMHRKVVSQAEWLESRKAHLAKEKELTRLRDQLSAERRELPWVQVEKEYVFDTPDGKKTLADLFNGRSQLIVHHFMLGPGWKAGCIGCSFSADHIEGALVHLEHHDVSLVTISRAPLAQIEAYKKRMGWHAKWVSSNGSDFNYDYHVSFTPEEIAKGKVYYNYAVRDGDSEELSGLSVFYRDERGDIFHTYSSFARGYEMIDSTYMLLDMTPKGRNETTNLAEWVRRHDEYDDRKRTHTRGGAGNVRR
jgi:predicted dithiol-disulfide oxidoreductase (DUF899 family)